MGSEHAIDILAQLVDDFDPFDYEQGLCYWCDGGWERVPGPRGGKGSVKHTGKHEWDCPFGRAKRLLESVRG